MGRCPRAKLVFDVLLVVLQRCVGVGVGVANVQSKEMRQCMRFNVLQFMYACSPVEMHSQAVLLGCAFEQHLGSI
jgi:hypothetical protein